MLICSCGFSIFAATPKGNCLFTPFFECLFRCSIHCSGVSSNFIFTASNAEGVGQSLFGDISNVPPPWHIRPVLLQDLDAIGVYFHLAHTLHPSPFQAKVEAADAGE